jgi:hypothetical protein
MVELAYLDTVKDSGDPKMFHAYLDKYPEGEFVRLARMKIAERKQPSDTESLK